MKKIIIIAVIALFSLGAMAQEDRKVAIFDPAGSVDNSIREIVREEISSIIVNTRGYTVLERQLINRVLEEHRFQQGGLVDDTQASELGRMIGANFVVVTSIAQLGANFYISCKMIDVETARIERQRTVQTQRGTSDLIEVVQRTVREMFAVAETSPPQQAQRPAAAVTIAPANIPAPQATSVYQGGPRQNGALYNPDGIELVYVEGTRIGMINEIQGFYIGKYEVTQSQWQAIMGSNPSLGRKGDLLPVHSVSWNDVQVFILKLNAATGRNYRLPTSSEWEFAARGGTMSRGYIYSGSNDILEVAWVNGNSNGVKMVGTKRPNELGIHDMSGNVWEWCHHSGIGAPRVRGGSYRGGRKWGRVSNQGIVCRANISYPYFGFRLVLQ